MFPGSEIGLAESYEVVSGFTVGSRPAPEVPDLGGGGPGVAVWSVKSPRMDSTFGMSSMFARAVLPTTPNCEGTVVPDGGRERTQGYQLRLETTPVFFDDFLLLALSYEKLEETGKEQE